MIPDQFDSVTMALHRKTRRSAMRTLGGLLALVPAVTAATANQSRDGHTGDDGGSRGRKGRNGADGRETHPRGEDGPGKHHGGGGKDVCRPTCPRGAVAVPPTSHGECQCAPVSPGLRDPDFTCGKRVNRNGDACCFCLYTTEGEGFCAVNTACDTLAQGSVTDCTSSDDCPRGRKCIPLDPALVEPVPTAGVCWPECRTTEGVTPNEPPL